MKNPSAVLHAPNDLRIEDRPVPTPLPTQVLVEVRATGICGSDVHYYDHGRIGDFVLDTPMVIGHESAGTIVDVGADIDPGRIGEMVALEPGVPCRECEQCLAGRYNLCPDVIFFATPPVDGSIARFVTIEAAFAHPAPSGISHEQAAMAEPVSVGVWACRKAGVGPGDRVLVTGAGPVGLLAAQVARAVGAAAVTVTDVNDFRLEAARGLALDARGAQEQLEATYNVLLECSGVAPAIAGGLRALAPAGRAVLVGMGADAVPIDVPLVQSREITLTGTFRYANTYPAALALIASGAVATEPIVTHRFSVEEAEAALTLGRRVPESLKAMVVGIQED